MNNRHTQILELLTKNKKMEVTELSEIFQVSQVTIRKDLGLLEDNGFIVREHGYATLNDSDDINNRLAYRYDIKRKIAKLAVDTIKNGETIMIESGSCCALVALEIAKTKKDITLITNSAFIANYIRKEGSIRIVLLGGEYQNESQVMVGPMTRRCAEAFFVDKLFIGADGFRKESGFTGNDYMRSETVKDMARQASQVIIVTDSAKFHQSGVVNLMNTECVNSIYTDSEIPDDIEEYLKEKNVKVFKTE
ncbi:MULTISPECIES: DeoR/GlpR family DNA-binding transcription regulator [Clostridium]|uniref:DeoR/GlpR family DNA-binding transcription regulator n=1 Tax=Clostridium TaxID=1485 RepID=UPI0005EB5F3E|nr:MULTISPECIES: DeoR/GlpR family DNA-binding transcription regulator [Clostridium]ALR90488.1 DeoR family transcriptional regulator [Clostridium butyricum]ALS18727.1 DeoR family transcriptional regulator [Clostridium butyricum]ANF15910.1 DeoR family transcriptional regulator [Clostridium butyricum]AOR95823.1 DeoR family transcriptional regulator [Clostridium butyricum]MCI3009958.1 DeoR/GlpR family DNA-binding transcription regulator [Clostridium butyricum]